MGCACNKSLETGSEPNRYPQFPATSFDPMGTYEPPVRMDSASRKFYGYGEGGAPIYVENVSLGGSEPNRYPQFPATSHKFFGYGADGAPIYVDSVSAAATKFAGYTKDGSPIFLENVSSKAYVGNMKDGTPIFVNASSDINPVNVLATAAICGAGLAFGWLIANAARNTLK